ncbi:unnamed protein product [Kluyveromyces dobzhanskii CBS 2104]|uniref:WGS project CCBQ000000000 data, contig 00106 n=1 Tax=Kluyveromyces dobzhanskii CBS 2104 TaxID=1427455 RepID=A0A0A8L649_9SACH|nr:unnamed protein product [Kluyveromyces dobzhanskii CBS 2104]
MLRYNYACIFLFSLVIVIFLGLTSDSRLTSITSTHDKIAHFIVFCIETVLFTIIFESKSIHFGAYIPQRVRFRLFCVFEEPMSINKFLLAFVVCCVCASTLSEFAQQILSNGKRSFDVFDILANFMGSSLGLGIAYIIEQ